MSEAKIKSMFRLLRKDEIDCRVGSIKKPHGDSAGGITLLLYKDARCDMNILDETVGPFNWKREHSRDNANCKVSLYSAELHEWVCKEDVGSPSNTEAEKGLASDSFKRACTNWGIGRELYTSPFIFIPGDPDHLKYDRYTVSEIGYLEETRVINKLKIVNRSGKLVFDMKHPVNPDIIEPEITPQNTVKAGKKEPKATVTTSETVPETDAQKYLKKMVEKMKDEIPDFNFDTMRKTLIKEKLAEDTPSKEISVEGAVRLVDAIYKRFCA